MPQQECICIYKCVSCNIQIHNASSGNIEKKEGDYIEKEKQGRNKEGTSYGK